MMEQIPDDVIQQIYTKFLFSKFLESFRYFFTFFKDHHDLTNALRLELFTW
jgi:hypothetical protein